MTFGEPVEENPYLDLFYGDPKTYGFPIQMWMLEQRHRMYKQAMEKLSSNPEMVIIMDRSVFSDIVFARLNHELGNINGEQMKKYLARRADILSKVRLPDRIIYLDVTPEICHSRLPKRNRSCETGVTVDYLKGLDEQYKQFNVEMIANGVKVDRLEWNNFGTTPSVVRIIDAPPQPSEILVRS